MPPAVTCKCGEAGPRLRVRNQALQEGAEPRYGFADEQREAAEAIVPLADATARLHRSSGDPVKDEFEIAMIVREFRPLRVAQIEPGVLDDDDDEPRPPVGPVITKPP